MGMEFLEELGSMTWRPFFFSCNFVCGFARFACLVCGARSSGMAEQLAREAIALVFACCSLLVLGF